MRKEDLKIVFMGTPDFAKIHLQKICENGLNVVGVFCQPDKPSGRGMKLQAPPVKEYALAKGIPVFQPEKLKAEKEKVEELLKELNPDVIFVVAYGKLLPKYILDYPRLGCINVHGSILPKYRGAAPIQWSIIDGEAKTGVTLMYMDEGMDTGNIIQIIECEIEKQDTYGILHDKLANIGSKGLICVIDKLVATNAKLSSVEQQGEFCLAPMLTKENSHINFSKNAKEIECLVKGTNPFPTAWCELKDAQVKVYLAHEMNIENGEQYSDKAFGEVVYLNDKKNILLVKANNSYVCIDELKFPGSRQMKSGDFIRGNKIKVGDILR